MSVIPVYYPIDEMGSQNNADCLCSMGFFLVCRSGVAGVIMDVLAVRARLAQFKAVA